MGNNKRSTNRQSWSQQSMKKALAPFNDEGMSMYKARIIFHVDKETLRRRVKDKIAKGSQKVSILPSEVEEEIFNYCVTMEEKVYGLTADDVRRLTFELAERNNINHPFSKDKRKAG